MKTTGTVPSKRRTNIRARIFGIAYFSVVLTAAALFVYSKYEAYKMKPQARTARVQQQSYVNETSLDNATPRLTTASLKTAAAARE